MHSCTSNIVLQLYFTFNRNKTRKYSIKSAVSPILYSNGRLLFIAHFRNCKTKGVCCVYDNQDFTFLRLRYQFCFLKSKR